MRLSKIFPISLYLLVIVSSGGLLLAQDAPDDLARLYKLARSAFKSEEYDRAFELFQKLERQISKNPEIADPVATVDITSALGYLYYTKGELETASEKASRAMELIAPLLKENPEDPQLQRFSHSIHWTLALISFDQVNYRSAYKALTEMAKLEQVNPDLVIDRTSIASLAIHPWNKNHPAVKIILDCLNDAVSYLDKDEDLLETTRYFVEAVSSEELWIGAAISRDVQAGAAISGRPVQFLDPSTSDTVTTHFVSLFPEVLNLLVETYGENVFSDESAAEYDGTPVCSPDIKVNARLIMALVHEAQHFRDIPDYMDDEHKFSGNFFEFEERGRHAGALTLSRLFNDSREASDYLGYISWSDYIDLSLLESGSLFAANNITANMGFVGDYHRTSVSSALLAPSKGRPLEEVTALLAQADERKLEEAEIQRLHESIGKVSSIGSSLLEEAQRTELLEEGQGGFAVGKELGFNNSSLWWFMRIVAYRKILEQEGFDVDGPSLAKLGGLAADAKRSLEGTLKDAKQAVDVAVPVINDQTEPSRKRYIDTVERLKREWDAKSDTTTGK